jgi:hypothetical protein
LYNPTRVPTDNTRHFKETSKNNRHFRISLIPNTRDLGTVPRIPIVWLCVEAGGRLNEQFLKLIDYFASISGSTEAERRAFTIYALQRIHLASQRGVAQLIRAQEPIPDGPCLLPPRGLLDLGVLPCRPPIQVTTTKRSEGQAPTWRDDAQRALSSLSIKNLLATIPVVHTPALASAAGAT